MLFFLLFFWVFFPCVTLKNQEWPGNEAILHTVIRYSFPLSFFPAPTTHMRKGLGTLAPILGSASSATACGHLHRFVLGSHDYLHRLVLDHMMVCRIKKILLMSPDPFPLQSGNETNLLLAAIPISGSYMS